MRKKKQNPVVVVKTGNSLKTCPACNTAKQRNEFGVNRQKPDGLSTKCSDCKDVPLLNASKNDRIISHLYMEGYASSVIALLVGVTEHTVTGRIMTLQKSGEIPGRDKLTCPPISMKQYQEGVRYDPKVTVNRPPHPPSVAKKIEVVERYESGWGIVERARHLLLENGWTQKIVEYSSLDTVMLAANTIRHGKGEPQEGKKDCWLVK